MWARLGGVPTARTGHRSRPPICRKSRSKRRPHAGTPRRSHSWAQTAPLTRTYSARGACLPLKRAQWWPSLGSWSLASWSLASWLEGLLRSWLQPRWFRSKTRHSHLRPTATRPRRTAPGGGSFCRVNAQAAFEVLHSVITAGYRDLALGRLCRDYGDGNMKSSAPSTLATRIWFPPPCSPAAREIRQSTLADWSVHDRLTAEGVISRPTQVGRPTASGRSRPRARRSLSELVSEDRR